MEIRTKYDIGQQVWPIQSCYASRIVACGICDRTGRVTIGGEELICPKCNGASKHPQPVGNRWWVEMPSFVGSINTETYSRPTHDRPDRIQYMLESTGVGTGRMWNERDVFASEDAASAECELRNAGKVFTDD